MVPPRVPFARASHGGGKPFEEGRAESHCRDELSRAGDRHRLPGQGHPRADAVHGGLRGAAPRTRRSPRGRAQPRGPVPAARQGHRRRGRHGEVRAGAGHRRDRPRHLPAGRAGAAAGGHLLGGTWTVDDLERVVRGAYPFAELVAGAARGGPRHARRPLPVRRVRRAEAAGGVGPDAGTVRGRDGSRALAVQNAGTIPDRGLYAVVLPDGARVGELDEEMVYEARSGQTFMLGASTWRIEEITRDRVGRDARPRGARRCCRSGRARAWAAPTSWARAVGRLARELIAAGPERGGARGCGTRAPSTSAPRPTWSRTSRTRPAATGTVPSDRAIVVERFRDEIGDWRLCVLTPFGAASTRPGPWPSARVRAATAQEPTRSGATTASPSTCPTPTRRRPPTSP